VLIIITGKVSDVKGFFKEWVRNGAREMGCKRRADGEVAQSGAGGKEMRRGAGEMGCKRRRW